MRLGSIQAFWNGGFMFHVGDKVVHPLHGAGVIEGMVERTIDDTPAWYYVLRPAFGDTELFLPWTAAADSESVRFAAGSAPRGSLTDWMR